MVIESSPALKAVKDPTLSWWEARDWGVEDGENAAPPSHSEDETPEARVRVDADAQLKRALEVLKSWSYFERLKQRHGANLYR